ncbi:protein NYNRIN [Trichonephila clavipes]|uniref:Protein NYNRIN n=1 Tax=Trichonephila clavipes TaxID=2585209 RepID=A0A8X6S9L5_TRICX|nr:protein NYNRIN [Trichonephila clavipes]
MSSPDRNLLQFQKIEFQHKVPFIIYADFESILIPYHSAQPTNQSAYSEKIARHKPCGYACVVIDANGKILKPITVYRGPDAATHFINNLIREKDNITPMLTTIMPLNLSPEEEQFNSETHCYLCKHHLENDKNCKCDSYAGYDIPEEAVSKNIPLELAYKLRPLKGYDLKVSYTKNYSFSEKDLDGVLKNVRQWV